MVMRLIAHLGIAASTVTAAAAAPSAPANSSEQQQILSYLDETLDWYRRVTAVNDSPINSAEVVLRETVRQNARQALRLGFDFAGADAALLEATTTAATHPVTTGSGGSAAGMSQAAATAGQRVARIQGELEAVQREIDSGDSTMSRALLLARHDKLVAQLDLAKARLAVLTSLASFATGADGGGPTGLAARVQEMRQSVPEAQTESAMPTNPTAGTQFSDTAAGATAAPATQPAAAAITAGVAAAAANQTFERRSSGILGQAAELITLSRRAHELQALADQADSLRRENETLRAPVRTALREALRRADVLGAAGSATATATANSDDPAKLAADRQELEALTARFRQLTSASVPLSEQRIVLTAAHDALVEWQGTLKREYSAILRHVVVRLIVLAALVIIVLGISALWRRATQRYVHDPRRRRQFMLVRRIVVGVVLLIAALSVFVTELGSLATFAGFITAGLAVALQTFILSGAAYFFFIGRYGVRVGDRVTVGGITGEVLETGFFRLYLMELGGADRLRPTGRVVVFSNSVLFQPAGFFKQMPGADYVYHEVALTLSPDSDHRLAEQRLMAAVERVYGEYKPEIDAQYAAAKQAPGHLPLPPPRPEGRLRFVDAGLEFVVRYPVELRRAAEADDRVTRNLLRAIEEEPKLKLVAAGTPKIQPAA
jgi:small-conductance mechanosensitive channel